MPQAAGYRRFLVDLIFHAHHVTLARFESNCVHVTCEIDIDAFTFDIHIEPFRFQFLIIIKIIITIGIGTLTYIQILILQIKIFMRIGSYYYTEVCTIPAPRFVLVCRPSSLVGLLPPFILFTYNVVSVCCNT